MASGGRGEAIERVSADRSRGLAKTVTKRRQRARLEQAMVKSVARHGYSETTVSELVRMAAVSKSTFYTHFEDKEDCFFVTLDTIIDEVSAKVGHAFRAQASLEQGLAAALSKFADFLVGESESASLVVVDSLSLGAAAVPHIERAGRAFEITLRESVDKDRGRTHKGAPSELAVRAIVGGIRAIIYRYLREGRPEVFAEKLEPLLAWALSYLSESKGSHPVAERPLPEGVLEHPDPDYISWSEPADSPLSRSRLSQRQRILRATAQEAARVGYPHLTIPAISNAAGTSYQTFYEYFESKEQAFISAFEKVAKRAMASIFAAALRETEWQAVVEAGMRGFLEYLAYEPLFGRLAFFELPTAGATALNHADATVQAFTGFLEPEALPPGVRPLPQVIVEAIGGAIWWTIQCEIAAGNEERLPELAPHICDVLFVPLSTR
jgi:AcrR family transcriptional regulator